jgi:putative ABC transport system permease protein
MRWYRWLLHGYPRSFRDEYGGELVALFEQRLRAASGIVPSMIVCLDAFFDVIGSAAAAHWDVARKDVRYAIRALRRSPGFAITAIMVTALGIGANTAAFSVADFVLFRPLPFATPDRLVTLWQTTPGYNSVQPSAPNYHDYQAMSRSFDAMGAYHELSVNVLGGSSPQQLRGIAVTGDLLPMLGVQPLLGHPFSAEETRDGSATVLLSYPLWRELFAGDPSVVGRHLTIEGQSYTVAGVMPRTFVYPDRTVSLYVPMSPAQANDSDRTNNWFYVVGRMRPGVTIAQAQSDLSGVAARLAQLHPRGNGDVGATVLGIRDGENFTTLAQARTLLLALCGAACCVLLIACTNLASLLLIRSLARRRELAVRAALGAGRERLVRQLVTESLLLATCGGIVGVGLAILVLPLLSRLIPPTLPLAASPSLDLRVLAAAIVLTFLTGIGFGVIPAIRGSGAAFAGLRDGARSGGGRRARLQSSLVVLEVAMSVVLLVITTLLVRTIWNVQAIDPGFNKANVVTFHVGMAQYRYSDVAARAAFYDRVQGAVQAIAGVKSSGFISQLPMMWGGGIWPVGIAGVPDSKSAERIASLRYITSGYLATLGIPLASGRDVRPGDTQSSAFVAIVSESFRAKYWPGVDPIGQHFKFALADRTVVGVVRDVKVRGLERHSEPQVYLPYRQVADSWLVSYVPRDFAVRSSLSTAALVPAVRRIIHDADPEESVSGVQTLDALVDAQTASRSLQARILAAFALVALVLAAVGIHGVLSYAVSQRSREIGVRMALGAQSGSIVAMVMRQGALLAIAGLVPGVALAYAGARAIASLLAGVQPADPATFGVAVTLCVMMTLAGSLAPVLRAVRVDPNSVLRTE